MRSVPEPLSSLPLPTDLVAVDAKVPAGFPSPAQDYIQKRIDLNETLVLNPLSTFLFEVQGDSMIEEHIFDGDRLIVDRSVEARDGRIVLACVDGEFTVKKLYKRGALVRLMPANPKYEPIDFTEGQEVSIWGVVTWNLRKVLHTERRL